MLKHKRYLPLIYGANITVAIKEGLKVRLNIRGGSIIGVRNAIIYICFIEGAVDLIL